MSEITTATLWVIGAWTAWHVVGAGVLAAIDTDGRLYEWAKSAPNRMLAGLVLTLWPVTVLMWFRPWRDSGDGQV